MYYKNLPVACCLKALVSQNEALLCTPVNNEVDFIEPHSFGQLRKAWKSFQVKKSDLDLCWYTKY